MATSHLAGTRAPASVRTARPVGYARFADLTRGASRRLGLGRFAVVAALLVLAGVTVWCLDAAGFNHQLSAVAIAFITADILASWYFVARANRGANASGRGSWARTPRR